MKIPLRKAVHHVKIISKQTTSKNSIEAIPIYCKLGLPSTYLSCIASVKTEYSEEILAYFMQLFFVMIATQLNMQGEWRNTFDEGFT